MSLRVLLRFLIRRYEFWVAVGLLVTGIWAVRSCGKRDVDKNWQRISAYGINFPMHYAMHGFDVSKHNGRIDWQRVARMEAGGVRMRFVYIKATEGATLSDKQFAQNWKSAGKADIPRGAYHFYHPTRDPHKQAQNFIRQVTLKPGDLAPALDFEVVNGVPDEKLIDGLQQWLDEIEEHYGIRPIIYTNGSLYRRYIKGNFDKYPLWIADYSNTHLNDYNPDKLYIWQHSQSGWIKGIRGPVDINTFVMDSVRMAELRL
jgi:lysozyme